MTKQEYISKEFAIRPHEAEKMCKEFHDFIMRDLNTRPCTIEEKTKEKLIMSWVAGWLETRELRED